VVVWGLKVKSFNVDKRNCGDQTRILNMRQGVACLGDIRGGMCRNFDLIWRFPVLEIACQIKSKPFYNWHEFKTASFFSLTFFGFNWGSASGTFYFFPQFVRKDLHFFAAWRAFNLDLIQGLVRFKSWTMLILFCHNLLLLFCFG